MPICSSSVRGATVGSQACISIGEHAALSAHTMPNHDHPLRPDGLSRRSRGDSMIPLGDFPIVVGYDHSAKARRAIECADRRIPGRREIVVCILGLSRASRRVRSRRADRLDEVLARRHSDETAAERCRVARAAGLGAVAQTNPRRRQGSRTGSRRIRGRAPCERRGSRGLRGQRTGTGYPRLILRASRPWAHIAPC